MHSLQNAPQVLFRNDPPLELQGIPGLKNSGDEKYSYITFGWSFYPLLRIKWWLTNCLVLFPRHLTPQRRYDSISHIQTFRDYFHYHIKASKVSHFSLVLMVHLVDCYRPTSTLACESVPLISSKVCRYIPTICTPFTNKPSSEPRETRERRARTKDGEWKDVSCSGLTFVY